MSEIILFAPRYTIAAPKPPLSPSPQTKNSLPSPHKTPKIPNNPKIVRQYRFTTSHYPSTNAFCPSTNQEFRPARKKLAQIIQNKPLKNQKFPLSMQKCAITKEKFPIQTRKRPILHPKWTFTRPLKPFTATLNSKILRYIEPIIVSDHPQLCTSHKLFDKLNHILANPNTISKTRLSQIQNLQSNLQFSKSNPPIKHSQTKTPDSHL